MSDTTDRAELIARLRDYSSGAGYGSDAFIEEVATALAQSERDLAEAQKSEAWMLVQKDLMRDQRDRAEQQLTEQAATISAERSARQAAKGELDEVKRQLAAAKNVYPGIREVVAERDALQQKVDAALTEVDACRSMLDEHLVIGDAASALGMVVRGFDAALTTPIESKEPKLDPEPWRQGNGCNHALYEGCYDQNGVLTPHGFAPRIGAGYSDDPADYGIEAPHD